MYYYYNMVTITCTNHDCLRSMMYECEEFKDLDECECVKCGSGVGVVVHLHVAIRVTIRLIIIIQWIVRVVGINVVTGQLIEPKIASISVFDLCSQVIISIIVALPMYMYHSCWNSCDKEGTFTTVVALQHITFHA